MLKFLIKISLLFLLLLPTKVASQSSITLGSSQYNQWIQVGNTCYGCSSFFIKVINTTRPDSKGLYYYDVYLWSNSFYSNGYVGSTYVKNIKVYAKDISGAETFILKLDYALVPPKSDYFNGHYYLAYVYSTSARQIIKIKWDNIEVW